MFIKLLLFFLNLVLPEKRRKNETLKDKKESKKQKSKATTSNQLSKGDVKDGIKPIDDGTYDRLTGADGQKEAALMKLEQFDHDKIKLDSFIIVVG